MKFTNWMRILKPMECVSVCVGGWGRVNLLEIDNAIELLSILETFYYNNGRLPLRNDYW